MEIILRECRWFIEIFRCCGINLRLRGEKIDCSMNRNNFSYGNFELYHEDIKRPQEIC